jgi:hypothetical protein
MDIYDVYEGLTVHLIDNRKDKWYVKSKLSRKSCIRTFTTKSS